MTETNRIEYKQELTDFLEKIEFFVDRVEITSMGGLPYGVDKEDFFSGFSVPRNKELMRVFRDLEIVEQLGSGIPRILKKYGKEAFEIRKTLLRVTMPYAKPFEADKLPPPIAKIYQSEGGEGMKVGEKVGEKLTRNQKMILQMMKKTPAISAKAISGEIGISLRKTEENMRKLRIIGIIRRIGPAKGGHWEILNK